jgi:plasmid stability protein
MRNLTLSIPDDVYKTARVQAAVQGKSISAMVTEYLKSLGNRQAEFAEARKRRNELLDSISGIDCSENVSREELYDRALR